MNFLNDCITYIRRIIKSPSDADISDSLLIDYINRFYIMDVDARIQLFDLKTTYRFQTTPGVDQYNIPLYTVQSETTGKPTNPDIAMYPVYQGFAGPAYINGVPVSFHTQKSSFFNLFPNVTQNMPAVILGNGTSGPYTFRFPISPNNIPPVNIPLQSILRGHVDISGIMSTNVNVDPPVSDAISFPALLNLIPTTSIYPAVYITSIDGNGNNVVITDSGIFLANNVNYGMLIQPGKAPFGNLVLPGTYDINLNTINYLTGEVTLNFPVVIPENVYINAQCYYFSTGLPRSILFYNNVLTLRSPPDRQYLVELDAYLSPAAFFSTENALPFGYMTEYIARGAARKILSDTGDIEQFQFYEPLFLEQEQLVWKRSQRQFTSTRTQTIYATGTNQMGANFGNQISSTF